MRPQRKAATPKRPKSRRNQRNSLFTAGRAFPMRLIGPKAAKHRGGLRGNIAGVTLGTMFNQSIAVCNDIDLLPLCSPMRRLVSIPSFLRFVLGSMFR